MHVQHRYGSDLLEADSPVTVPATSPAERKILCGNARQLRFYRDLRQESFDRNLFGEPAWDILLALYVIDGEQRRLNTGQVAALASQPLTTVLRWLDYLAGQDLIRRQASPFDHRVVHIELSDKGRAAMDEYLTKMRSPDMFRHNSEQRTANGERPGLEQL
jgi:DNA-binding MarR family transcriptional regulator